MSDIVNDWMNAAGKIPLLTPAEEIHCSTLVRRWLDWPDGKEAAPFNVRRSGEKARDRMIAANLRLVASNARSFTRRIGQGGAVSFEDLLQEGTLGLARGVDLFDPARGYKFSTYATNWILQGLRKCCAKQLRTIRLPGGALDIERRWRYKGDMTLGQFCEQWNYKPQAVISTLQAIAQTDCRSMDAGVRLEDGDGGSLGDFVPAAADEDELLREDFEQAVARLEAEADPEDLRVLRHRLDGGTASELGLNTRAMTCAVKEAKQRLALLAADDRQLVSTVHGKISTPPIRVTKPMTNNGAAVALEAVYEAPAAAEPAKAKRRRRSQEEMAQAKAERQPPLVTVAIGGMAISGSPASLAAVLRELQRGAA